MHKEIQIVKLATIFVLLITFYIFLSNSMVKNLLFFDCLDVEPVFRKNKSSFAEI